MNIFEGYLCGWGKGVHVSVFCNYTLNFLVIVLTTCYMLSIFL